MSRFSLLIEVDSSLESDDDSAKIGHITLQEPGCLTSRSNSQQHESGREIHIVLPNQYNDLLTKAIGRAIGESRKCNVISAVKLPNDIGALLGERQWVSESSYLSHIKNIRSGHTIDGSFNGGLCLPFPSKNYEGSHRKIIPGWHKNFNQVAIDIFEIEFKKTEVDRAQHILKSLAIHENLVRYFSCETVEQGDRVFVYLATELCLCSIEDLLTNTKMDGKDRIQILKSLTIKGIMLQATRALEYLHRNNFVHRNSKPNNFLVKTIESNPVSYVIKLTDFRLTREIDTKKIASTQNKTSLFPNEKPKQETSGTIAQADWATPESPEGSDLTTQSDVFLLGCFFHYILTGMKEIDNDIISTPEHPFLRSQFGLHDITQSKSEVYKNIQKEDWMPDGVNDRKASNLFKSMIKYEYKQRPTLVQVLSSDYFQTSKEVYPIYQAKSPGLCVIFNQINIPGKEPRHGTDKDRDKLMNTFHNLGFDIKTHEDKSSLDIQCEVKLLASKNYENYGCLVVCLLSHGVENAIAGSDGKLVNINQLQYLFSYKNCKSLYGKPKIFIVQACQGKLSQNMTGDITFPYDEPDSATESVVSMKSGWQSCNPNNATTTENGPDDGNPPIMDFITINSTIPGFYSFRNPVFGSFFIQSLCEKLDEATPPSGQLEDGLDLESILKGGVQAAINKKLSDFRNFLEQKIERGIKNPKDLAKAKHDNFTSYQTIKWEVSLSKSIHFHRMDFHKMNNNTQ